MGGWVLQNYAQTAGRERRLIEEKHFTLEFRSHFTLEFRSLVVPSLILETYGKALDERILIIPSDSKYTVVAFKLNSDKVFDGCYKDWSNMLFDRKSG